MNTEFREKVETVLDELNNEALGGLEPAVLGIVRQALLSQKVGTTPQDTMLAARDLFDRAKSKLELWNERKPVDAQVARKRSKEAEDVKPAMDLSEDKNISHTEDKLAADQGVNVPKADSNKASDKGTADKPAKK